MSARPAARLGRAANGPLAATLARAARGFARPEGDQWDPAWSFGPIERAPAAQTRRMLGWILRHRGELAWLWERLEDDASRAVLAGVLAHRLAGGGRIAHGVRREEAEALARFVRTALAPRPVEGAAARARKYDLGALGLDWPIATLELYAIQTFLLEQYRHPAIEAANVRPGDHVVDGGAFWGDTALWFAEQVGDEGHVVAFEADPTHVPLLRANLEAAGGTGARVAVRQEALWDAAAELRFHSRGPASAAWPGGELRVPAVALDALVEAGEIERVDVLKLDVEGAELAALDGAAGTIRRFRPRLAVAAYHRLGDVFDLPRRVEAIAPGYRFALTHRSVNRFETMLFAWPEVV